MPCKKHSFSESNYLQLKLLNRETHKICTQSSSPNGIHDHIFPSDSLVVSFPGLPRFYLCAHYNTWERKTGKKRERPGSIHHMSGREVDIGGEGPIFKCIRTKLESEFFTGQDE